MPLHRRWQRKARSVFPKAGKKGVDRPLRGKGGWLPLIASSAPRLHRIENSGRGGVRRPLSRWQGRYASAMRGHDPISSATFLFWIKKKAPHRLGSGSKGAGRSGLVSQRRAPSVGRSYVPMADRRAQRGSPVNNRDRASRRGLLSDTVAHWVQPKMLAGVGVAALGRRYSDRFRKIQV